jgi:formate hydrogenlyase subunit 3/multisubunit Na+/H+ antiporter MnhD subunit
MIWVWIAIVALPLVLAALIPFGGSSRRLAMSLGPFAAVPALFIALAPEIAEPATATWLLLGTGLGTDQLGHTFLLVAGLVWTAAGIYARVSQADDLRGHRFWFFFLLTMTGNFGVVLANDIVTFYTAFALMTFAAYGLIVHLDTEDTIRAGRIYIVMAVVGEAMLIAGLIMAAFAGGDIGFALVQQGIAESERQNLIIFLLLGGFGIKAGMVPLHITLPLIYPSATIAGAAVLAGPLIKAGLLGWLRTLPIGYTDLSGWGLLIVVVSLVAVFGGVLIGLAQQRSRSLLAYSSISQMGLIGVLAGVAVAYEDAWPIAVGGVMLFVLHHGLIKSGLFLGVGAASQVDRGSWVRWLAIGGLALGGISLAGPPLTTGALAKSALKEGVEAGPSGWVGPLELLLALSAIGTTLLIGRMLWLVWTRELGEEPVTDPRARLAPWLGLLGVTYLIVWLAPGYYAMPIGVDVAFKMSNLWVSTWPVMIGLAIVAVIWIAAIRGRALPRMITLPEGDIVEPVERFLLRVRPFELLTFLPRPHDPVAALSATWYGLFAESARYDRTRRFGHWLIRWDVASLLFLVISIFFVVLMLS